MSAGRPAGRKLLPAILAAPARAVSHAAPSLGASSALHFAPSSPRPSRCPLPLCLRLLHATLLDRDLLLGLLRLLPALAAAWLCSWLLLDGLLLSWGGRRGRGWQIAVGAAGNSQPVMFFHGRYG